MPCFLLRMIQTPAGVAYKSIDELGEMNYTFYHTVTLLPMVGTTVLSPSFCLGLL